MQRMLSHVVPAVLVLCGMWGLGCTTSKTVTIYSNPPGATISIGEKTLGQAPVETKLSFEGPEAFHTVTARKEGYRKTEKDIYYQPDTQTEYTVTLEKQDTVMVLLHEMSPAQQRKDAQIVVAEIETTAAIDYSEPCPNSSDVTNVTGHEPGGPSLGRIAVSPRPDNDGNYFLIYTVMRKAERTAYANLMRHSVSADGAKTPLTRDEHRNFGAAITPDGKQVVYSSLQYSTRFRLWLMSVTGEGGPKIYGDPEGDVFWPDISADGSTIAFTLFSTGTDRTRVWTVNADGTLARVLDEGREPKFNPAMKQSPDILYIRRAENALRYQIWIMNAKGRLNRPIGQDVPERADVKNPGWSPDGKWVVFASKEGKDRNERHNWDIWIMRAGDGKLRTRLTENGSWDDNPVWGNDGYIYFRSNRGGAWNIWRLKPRLDRIGQ